MPSRLLAQIKDHGQKHFSIGSNATSSPTTADVVKSKAAKSNNRWKADEHASFLDRLEKHGRDFVKLAEIILTRSHSNAT